VIDFRVEKEEAVYPMVPTGAGLANMIRRPKTGAVLKTPKLNGRKVEMMYHTIVALVEDKPGVLNRVASLFRRRAFNIESLTVGHTESPGLPA
jgi:hypothetical protein